MAEWRGDGVVICKIAIGNRMEIGNLELGKKKTKCCI